MTGNNTDELAKLNSALKDDDGDDAPEWARSLVESIDENTRRLEELAERRSARQEATRELLEDEVAPQIERNAKAIRDLAATTGHTAGIGTEQNGTGPKAGTDRKVSEAWDETLGVE